jgi:beta-glucosidase
VPYVQATEVKASSRKVPYTAMGWEINAGSFYNILKRFDAYKNVRSIIVSENGAYFKDELKNGVVNDFERINYFQQYLKALLKAKKDGIKVDGYFAWTLTDNFEWAEGFKARFGLIHIDFETQLRTIKNSGYWWRDFLRS